jgi:crotonobetainyl-CoA:carnitine CoA-transferase CaiB-like acyl-CoA transferase
MPERVFDGLQVIDCASYIAGPAAATVMSDFGAEVVKIEPPGGDPYRRRAVPPVGPGHDTNPGFVLDARNKKSLALDLAQPAGQQVLHRLVEGADVFVTNYPPPVRRRLAIAYDDLAPLNGRLIYASFSGYGEAGAEADKPGFDATAYWARTGLMHLVRAGEAATPARSLAGMGDHPSAMALYGAIVTALYQRERTGRGGYVASSLLANGLWANGCSVQARLCGESVMVQPPREAGLNALRLHYRCRDNRWLLLSIVADEGRWQRFTAALASPALDDPRFATVALRESHPRELIAVLDAIFASRDLAEWARRLDAARIIFGTVGTVDEIPDDRQMRDAGALVRFAGSDLLTVNSPIFLAGQEKVPPRPAPRVGEHAEAVLCAAGFTAAEIAELRAAGVIAGSPAPPR